MDTQLGKDLTLKIEKADGKIKLSLVLAGEVEATMAVAVTADTLIDHIEALIPGDVDKLILEPVRAALKA